jgi:hypothetical protein
LHVDRGSARAPGRQGWASSSRQSVQLGVRSGWWGARPSDRDDPRVGPGLPDVGLEREPIDHRLAKPRLGKTLVHSPNGQVGLTIRAVRSDRSSWTWNSSSASGGASGTYASSSRINSSTLAQGHRLGSVRSSRASRSSFISPAVVVNPTRREALQASIPSAPNLRSGPIYGARDDGQPGQRRRPSLPPERRRLPHDDRSVHPGVDGAEVEQGRSRWRRDHPADGSVREEQQ